MIDIHTHILPQVDDGARTLEESIEMIKESIKCGVKKIICTPHYMKNLRYDKTFDEVNIVFENLKIEVKNRNLDIELFLAQEIYYTKDVVDLLNDGICSSINKTKYLLIEFPIYKSVDVESVIYDIIVSGYIPIICHPERYLYIKDIKPILNWKDIGALIQINSDSFLGVDTKQAKKISNILLENNLVDFIASDTHRKDRRVQNLDKAFNLISKKFGSKYADTLFITNPEKLLNNEIIE